MSKLSLPGIGIVKGMVVTGKNLVGSYFDPKRLITVKYPEERRPLPENSRSVPFLIFDGDDAEAGLRCVACLTCEKECPPNAISIVMERDEKGKPVKQPKVFDIDISVCMGCQICVEVCPFDAIKMDHTWDHSTFERFESLVLDKEQLAKPNSYYHSIKPTEAAEVDEALEADRKRKEEARQKRQATSASS